MKVGVSYNSKTLLEDFQQTPAWQSMLETVEASPWHREANVAVHTEMVLNESVNRFNGGNWYMSGEKLVGFIALLFHDVGKPVARTFADNKKVREDGTVYYKFSRHEKVSARYWENYFVTNYKHLNETYGLDALDSYKITWLIENHLPYGISKPRKVARFWHTVNRLFDDAELFFNVLISDCYGRISDDHDEKKKSVHDWIEWFKSHDFEFDLPESPTLYMLIGASGSGKSTYYRNMSTPYEIYSYDLLRVEYHVKETGHTASNEKEAYDTAYDWIHDEQHPERYEDFQKYKRDVLMTELKAGKNIVVDNMNVGSSTRNEILEAARQKKYRLIAVLFPISKKQLKERNESRTDKSVPWDHVMQAYHGITMPFIGEFHEVEICETNLEV